MWQCLGSGVFVGGARCGDRPCAPSAYAQAARGRYGAARLVVQRLGAHAWWAVICFSTIHASLCLLCMCGHAPQGGYLGNK